MQDDITKRVEELEAIMEASRKEYLEMSERLARCERALEIASLSIPLERVEGEWRTVIEGKPIWDKPK